MFTKTKRQKKDLDDLLEIITDAMRKIGASNENDLCRYLPGRKGRLHHLTFQKMKRSNPVAVVKMLEEYIIKKDKPQLFPPNHRSPRTSNKSNKKLRLKQSQISRLVDILKKEGETELSDFFSSQQSVKSVQSQLIQSIR